MGPIEIRSPTDAKRAYAVLLGWKVTVGHRYRPRAGCTCGNRDCPYPGAHPWEHAVERTADEVALGGALIAQTHHFDALVMPRILGLATLAALGELTSPPCIVDHLRTVILVLPATGRYAVGDCPASAVELRTGKHGWVALPPSRHTRWDTPPWSDRTGRILSLPHGKDIRRSLAEASTGPAGTEARSPIEGQQRLHQ